MSRIGKQPITIKDSVDVTIEDGGAYGNIKVVVKGPKGELTEDIRQGISINIDADNKVVNVDRANDDKSVRALHGLYRALIDNMIEGVTNGYQKTLEIHGVGYRVKLAGKNLDISLGQNHPLFFECPEGIEFEVQKDVDIIVKGIDKQLVGETAAQIRSMKKPEPYKGKGIRYQGEYVRRKEGKSGVK